MPALDEAPGYPARPAGFVFNEVVDHGPARVGKGTFRYRPDWKHLSQGLGGCVLGFFLGGARDHRGYDQFPE
jgi:hypothetical protein